ncbi:MAG: cryptochrome/photolyase family protein, partial [Chitinophagaceae bacterium]|nr:cryptochrome/photolyase family protein [Chitinophagaceae bacterium]
QLFKNHPSLRHGNAVYLVEDDLYFNQYKFHKSKLVLHRASMKCYASELVKKGFSVTYISAVEEQVKLQKLFTSFAEKNITAIHYADTTDYLLERRILRYGNRNSLKIVKYPSPNFICDAKYLDEYFDSGKKYFLAKFYEDQRKRLGILMDGGNPAGGKWSFDADNRQKMPAGIPVPDLPRFENPAITEAKNYIEKNYGDNYGKTDQFNYPVTHAQATSALQHFLKTRFDNFGIYQDAIVKKQPYLFHSVLSSSLNIGLLDPAEVIEQAIGYAVKNNVPFNSLEGFVRQVLGWREYMRAVYVREGVKQRQHNFMCFTRKLPASFYTGKTGIEPIDVTIEKIMKTGYAHHIERLMILGNFMLLCEFDPNDVYQWFMELFIDAYDWVMVPNVYGMSQFANGRSISTKPYFSSSNYILKMSDYKKGAWCDTWDALFWRFMHVHRDMIGINPRLSMLLNTFDKMPLAKRNTLLSNAEAFLKNIDQQIAPFTLF